MAINPPQIINEIFNGHAGRGRPAGCTPKIIVIHTQAGNGDPLGYFKSLDKGPSENRADCTIWNSKEGKLYRYMWDTDTVWTNGGWTEPVNHANPILDDLCDRGVYSGDVALTVENEGFQTLTEAQLNSLAQLCAWWCQTYNIPADRNHIVGHSEIGPHKQCPGFDLNPLVARVQQLMKGASQPVNNIQSFNSIDVVTNQPRSYVVNSPILDFYRSHGGIETYGLPISDEREASFFGLTYKGTAQMFEGGRIEWHEQGGCMKGRTGAELLIAQAQLAKK